MVRDIVHRLDASYELLRAAHSVLTHEQVVKNVAAQLLQTIQHLHFVAELCHLDVTSSNVMLRTDDFEPWDQVRLIDFGFSQDCLPDLHSSSVVPQGTTPAYGAPEILRSLQKQYEQQGLLRVCSGIAINGPAADYWGAGIVVYKFLTGHLPFDCKDSLTASKAPTYVLSRHQPYWEAYESILHLQQTWAQACSLAEETGCLAQHPLLDRVRQCSVNPEQAVLFFQQILNPVPHVRAQAVHHTLHPSEASLGNLSGMLFSN